MKPTIEELMREKPDRRVPEEPPYGSITDGDHVCTRCGRELMGCSLCAGMVVSVRKVHRHEAL